MGGGAVKKHSAYMILNRVLQWLWLILGALGLLFWGVGTLGVAMDVQLYGLDTVIAGAVLAALSGWMFVRGLARGRLAKSCRMATRILERKPGCTVEEMAAVIGMKPEKLRCDLRRLTKHNVLPGYMMNAQNGELMLLAHASPVSAAIAQADALYLEAMSRGVRCGSCGATSARTDSGRCEYCGSALDA